MEALPRMRARRAGRIVNISSIGGKVPVPHLAPYCASKFAVTGLSGSLRPEAARDRVYITNVCPGLMRTGSHVNAAFKGRAEEEYAWFKWGGLLGSVGAEHAAARILRAIRLGEAEVVIGGTALAAARLYGAAPEWSSDVLSLATGMLPRAGGIGRGYLKGREAESHRTQSRLMRPLERAAVRNNEMPEVGQETEDPRG
jgi:short-subunit dehydrogenase